MPNWGVLAATRRVHRNHEQGTSMPSSAAGRRAPVPATSTITHVLKGDALKRAGAGLGRYEQLPNVTLRLTPDEHWLLHWMLANPEDFTAPIRQLYRLPSFRSVGMGDDRVREAAAGLAAKGYYSYWSERDPAGRVYRVRAVTPVPNQLPMPTTRFLVSPVSHLLASKDADSPEVVMSPSRHRGTAGQTRGGPTPPRVPPAETHPAEDIAAGQTRGGPTPPRVPPAETHPAEDIAAGQTRGGPTPPRVPPAETVDWSDVFPGQQDPPSRAPAIDETDRQTNYPPSVVEQRSQGHPDGEGGEIEQRHQRMAYDVVMRLPRQLQMGDRERAEALGDIAAKLAEGFPVSEVVAEIAHDLPEFFKSRPGFIRARLAKMGPWVATPSGGVHAVTLAERGVFAPGQRPGVADAETARAAAHAARAALLQERASVRDHRSGG